MVQASKHKTRESLANAMSHCKPTKMSTTKLKKFWKLPLALDETQRIFGFISLGYPFVGSGLTHPALSFLSTYNIIGQGCVNIAMVLTQP